MPQKQQSASSSINPADTIKHIELGGAAETNCLLWDREGCSICQVEISFSKQSKELSCGPCQKYRL